jgi:uncharacterized delta-60 repeat protein
MKPGIGGRCARSEHGWLHPIGCESLEPRRLLAAGALDPSFGTGGRVTVDFGANMVVESDAATVQPDGKTVIVGQGLKLEGNTAVAVGFAAARLNIDGTLDTTFGPARTGTAFTQLGTGAKALAVALQADGKIVAAGVSDEHMAVVRYNADGTPDKSFDGDGIKTWDFGWLDGSPVARAVLVQRDGRIVIGGDGYFGGLTDGNIDFVFVRLLPDGSFDPTFDFDGKHSIGFGSDEGLGAMTIDYSGTPDTNPRYGSIVATGDGGPDGNDQLTVLRLRPDGSLDSSFDGDGKIGLHYAPDHATFGRGVVIQEDGKVVVAGSTYDTTNKTPSGLVLLRFQPDGHIDPSFGSSGDGWVFTDFGTGRESALDMIQSADGGLIVGGTDGSFNTSKNVIAAYTGNGLPDGDYPNGGKVVLPFSNARDLAPGPGRRFVFAGGDHKFDAARVLDAGANVVYATNLDPVMYENYNGTGPRTRGFTVYQLERLPYANRIYFDVTGTATPPPAARGGRGSVDYTAEGMVFPIAFPGVSTVPYVDIPAGQTFQTVFVTPVDDALVESNETAVFTIRSSPGYEIGTPRSAPFVIVDNDAPPPKVTEVYLRGSAWGGADNLADNLTFQEKLASAGVGDAALGYRLDPAPAGTTVPWVNVDQVILRYDQPQPNTPAAASIVLDGVRSDYAATGVTKLDDRTFALALNRPLGSDPAGGNDGDRIHLTVSGGGANNGTYALDFNVLQGDVDGSGQVVAADFSAVKKKFFKSTNDPVTGADSDYGVFHDVNGDGVILASDFSEVKKRFFDARPLAPAALTPLVAPTIAAYLFGVQRILV